MENKYFISECTLIPTEGSSLKQQFEISGGNPNITYYESVKSPSISVSIDFIKFSKCGFNRINLGGFPTILIVVNTPLDPQRSLKLTSLRLLS